MRTRRNRRQDAADREEDRQRRPQQAEEIIFPGDKLQVIGNDDQLQKFNTALQSDLLPEEAEIEKREY